MPRLMLRDKVTLRIGGGRDENDDPIPATNVVIAAEVTPISGEEQAQRGRMSTSVECRFVVTDPRAWGTTSVTYRGDEYTCQGKWQRFVVGGRLHHLEVVGRFGTG